MAENGDIDREREREREIERERERGSELEYDSQMGKLWEQEDLKEDLREILLLGLVLRIQFQSVILVGNSSFLLERKMCICRVIYSAIND